MIEVTFTPPTASSCEGEIEVEFRSGISCFIKVTGEGRNVDVSLSTPSVALDSTYITLVSQKTLRIINNSEMPISFSWKSFANNLEDEFERQRLEREINRMEDIEMNAFFESVEQGAFAADNLHISLDETSWEVEDGDDDANGYKARNLYPESAVVANLPFAARAVQSALVRKYRNLRRALRKDSMHFVDDIFEISPIEGQVWASSEIEVTVSFKPDTAAVYNCLTFLDITGREQRLSLSMAGQGVGPHAALSFDVLDTGDVFVNDPQRYQLLISNKGDINCNWSFLSSLTKFGNKFKFCPKEGFLVPGQSSELIIDFTLDTLGEFCEHFRFSLAGNDDMLIFQIKGHVIGPTFSLDCESIDFGLVSYDYLHTFSAVLTNTSKISMMYCVHVPQDGSYTRKEFTITSAEGVLTPGEQVELQIEFIPCTVKVYDYSLAIDVLGVGDMLLCTPITAECIVGPLQLINRQVSLGECFLRFPYEHTITLSNPNSAIYTKFEFLPQVSYTR